MRNIVITDIHVITRLYRIGLLKYFSSKEIIFYITNLCYYTPNTSFANDRTIAKIMLDNGMLKIMNSGSDDIIEINRYYQKYKPKFVVKTISAMLLAKNLNYILFTDDELLREITMKELNVRVHGKEWLATSITNEISIMGITVDVEMIKDMI